MFRAQNKLSMDKERYKQRLHELVERLKTQDPDLFAYLQQEVRVAQDQHESDARIDKIETYLGLDYKLDGITPAAVVAGGLDYSFVNIPSLCNQLNADFREMMRYRYGTRSHKADFYEYCKYAHFQLEALTNYFMNIWSTPDEPEDAKPDIELAKKNIKEYWIEKYELSFSETQKNIEDIPYQTKIRPILNFLKIKDKIISNPPYIYYNAADIVDYIRKTRNACSHRGVHLRQTINETIDDFEINKTFYISKNGKSRLYDFQNNWEVKFYLWLRDTPWDDVIAVLTIVATNIQANLY